MKKLLALILAIIMTFSLFACATDKSASETTTQPPVTEVPTEEPAAEETTATPTEKPTQEPTQGSTEELDDPVLDESGWQAGFTSGEIPVNGGKVFYRLYGEDKPGIPLIFLHGGPGSNATAFFKTTSLADDRPVLYYNQLGSDGSDISEDIQTAEQASELFTIERFPDELETIVEYFGFEEYALAGHSWGSMLAVEYAGTKMPEGLKGLVLIGPFLNVDLWLLDAQRLIKSLPDGEEMWEVVVECESTGNYTEEYDRINTVYSDNFYRRNASAADGNPTEPPKRVVEDFSVYNYMWGPSEFSCTGTLQGHDSTKLLRNISIPVIYISGEYDSGSPAAAAFYNSLTLNGSVAVIKGTAHDTPREDPVAFNKVVRKFMEALEKE